MKDLPTVQDLGTIDKWRLELKYHSNELPPFKRALMTMLITYYDSVGGTHNPMHAFWSAEELESASLLDAGNTILPMGGIEAMRTYFVKLVEAVKTAIGKMINDDSSVPSKTNWN